MCSGFFSPSPSWHKLQGTWSAVIVMVGQRRRKHQGVFLQGWKMSTGKIHKRHIRFPRKDRYLSGKILSRFSAVKIKGFVRLPTHTNTSPTHMERRRRSNAISNPSNVAMKFHFAHAQLRQWLDFGFFKKTNLKLHDVFPDQTDILSRGRAGGMG